MAAPASTPAAQTTASGTAVASATPAVTAKTGSSIPSASTVSNLPQWSTTEKVKRLQSALDSANRALLAQQQRIADLNEQTIRFLIDNKFMTEEEWMAMNPPAGYTYRLDRTGKIELVGSDNKPLSNADMASLDKKATTSTSTSTSTSTATEVKAAADTTTAVNNDASQADADAKSKQEAHDKAVAEAKSRQRKSRC